MSRASQIGACLVALVLVGAIPVEAQTAGPYIRVPHPAGTVYVPLDPSGQPAFPPAGPAAPSSPRGPGAPSAPSPADWGSITIEVLPGTATVYIDGERVGTAQELSASRRVIPLAPGAHRLEIALAGFQPIRATVEVTRRESYLVRTELVPDPAAPGAGTRGGGYVVVPPARERVDPPGGSGYQVVPRP